MNLKKIFYFILVIVFVFGLIFFASKKTSPANNVQSVKIAGQIMKVDLALTPEIQAKGLSGRATLPEDQGMLFIFENPGRYPFWMKDMNFPIDMIWLDENLNVVYIKKNALPESYPECFGTDKNAKYVLEVISGFSEKNNLKEGDQAKFLP